MLPVHDQHLRAKITFAASRMATGLFAANASGRGGVGSPGWGTDAPQMPGGEIPSFAGPRDE